MKVEYVIWNGFDQDIPEIQSFTSVLQLIYELSSPSPPALLLAPPLPLPALFVPAVETECKCAIEMLPAFRAGPGSGLDRESSGGVNGVTRPGGRRRPFCLSRDKLNSMS